MNRRILCLLLLVGISAPAAAQFPRPRSSVGLDPNYWVGLSYGYLQGISLSDEASNSTWEFAYTSQVRATFEKTIQRGTTVGVSAGFSNARLTYSGGALSNPCGLQCEATADITQYLAFVRGGGSGIGFHGMYTLEGGVTQFGKFRDQSSGNELPPTDSKYDFTFGLGAGVGFGLSANADVYVGEQFDFVMHPQSTAARSQSAPRMFTFRAGFRVGF